MKKNLPCGRALPRKERHQIDDSTKEALREKLQAYIKLHELNQSEVRAQILEVVLGQGSHFNIGEIVKIVQQKFAKIGMATVYRSISVFVSSGILRETLTDEQGSTVYEIAEEDHHDHIVCLDCGEIFEFHDESIERMQDKIAGTLKFKPVSHRHVIYAHCEQKK